MAAPDTYEHYPSPGVSAPADNGAVVTPSDSADLPNVPAGVMLPIRATRVMATGTTASGIRAFW
jgi:hypothetical protein